MRGGKCWFAIESKTFDVSLEEVRGKLRGTIVERSRGFSSWIRFGVTSLRKFLEGKGLLGGWAIFAEKLRDLGVVTQEEVKFEEALQVEPKPKAVIVEGKDERCLGKVRGRGLRSREEGLGRCLVGRWDDGSVVETELLSVRKWGERSWNIKNGMKVLSMGGPFMLLEFEDEEEAERVLKRGRNGLKTKCCN
ncbi:hypothetical protein CK203_084577 [Vitis vinifera]|uniref:DUF4283 domain-containing protein n=1 Tax=Vitis vinifera TaxID=29760 RepID=A0A438DNR5_VITVI|nr:hypothetical protein CK203_084577 [Vitis vinifera]